MEPGDKIEYWTRDGNQCTGYVTQVSADRSQIVAEHKHTDRPSVLHWDDVAGAWAEGA